MKNAIKQVRSQFKGLLVEKEKELMRLRRKVEVIETEKDKKSQAIHSQLASLLSVTDKHNPENAASKDKQKDEIRALKIRLKENQDAYTLRFQQMADERAQLEMELEQAQKALEELSARKI